MPFASDLEQREVLSAYIADGLLRGERVLYYSDKTAPDAIDAWLDPRGVDGALAMARGQLEVRPATDDHFDPGTLVDGIRDAIRDARAAGFQGLRLTGEMSWALRRVPDTGRLHEYESGVASTVTGSEELAAICQYDERLFDRADVSGLVARHPGVVCVDPLHDDRRLRIVPTYAPRGLRVQGTVDELSAAPFAEALAHTTQWPEAVVVIDLAELRFIDVAGIRTLVRAAEALPPGRTLQVRNLAPTLRNVLRIVGWDATPGLTIGEPGMATT
ncbi:MEDS domain-containing protein [Dactylosporangium aurantiacum]|uniref:MEDS domain-containing protein n=1 Tax=Dactylosporangium aurantiacum TaxID=35754 RepID=UPI0024356FE7|nr:MEDS domain-containing protein [Dactylosporangium aurantiacum]MDG6107444.1 MEDS domain-containing protein [Dactylosporangium aurantiacum]